MRLTAAVFLVVSALVFIRPDPVEAWSSNDGAVVVFAGPGDDKGDAVAVDSSGNVYTIGHFGDTVDFDPGSGTANLTSNGGSDVFVSKLDSSGNYVWAKSFGGPEQDQGYGVAVDSSSNVYITGSYRTDHGVTVDFDPGPGTANLATTPLA